MPRPTTAAISPCFIVTNVDRTIAFYRDKLGFEPTFQEPNRIPSSHRPPRRSADLH